MGLFDFLKGNKKRRKSGGRSAQSQARRSDQGTMQMPLPQHPRGGFGQSPMPAASPSPSPPVYDSPGHSSPPNATVARRRPPELPEAPRVQSNHRPPPPAHVDTGATQYIGTDASVGGDIVGILVVIDGELKGNVYKVTDGENRIGRSTECEIELSSKKISRHHALLIHQDAMFVIKPVSDKNPTFINDTKTDGDELGDGDTIRLGLTTLKFRTI